MDDKIRQNLKPCPYCGSNDIFIGQGGVEREYQRKGAWGVDVFCRKCGAACRGIPLPEGFHKLNSKDYKALWPGMMEKAAEQWNCRS